MESILKKLQNLSESDFYPYHMPGHKRLGNEAFKLDITEIDEFDNLHHATEILKEAQERAAKVYGAKQSFYLVNGSTCGLLTAVFAAFQPGDTVLVARNCHKAVYHAVELRGLKPVYLYPETEDGYDMYQGISGDAVRRVLTGQIKGMILTSPTYEGLTCELKEIARILHEQDGILIVDEAHGAHLGFHPGFPESAVTQGADVVIQSLHKTLPSMTQTALLHVCTERVSAEHVQKFSGMFQTSSPSYVFMAYMDECVRRLEQEKEVLFDSFLHRLRTFYGKAEGLKYIRVRQPEQANAGQSGEFTVQYVSDPGKIVISAVPFYTGKELYSMLRERFHLQLEMCTGSYALAIVTICDGDEGFARLYEALETIDRELATGERACTEDVTAVKEEFRKLLKKRPLMKYMPCEAERKPEVKVRLQEAKDCVSKEYIYLYPPGIPFIVPGEVLEEEMLSHILFLQKAGYELQGLSDENAANIKICAE